MTLPISPICIDDFGEGLKFHVLALLRRMTTRSTRHDKSSQWQKLIPNPNSNPNPNLTPTYNHNPNPNLTLTPALTLT